VFLGAGLLVGAIFALLILRKFYPRRRREAAALALSRRNEGLLDEKPLLWDVQLETQGNYKDGYAYENSKWDAMTPMSVSFIPDNKIPPPAPLPLITIDSLDSGMDTPRTSRLSGLRRHLHLGRSHTPQPSETESDSTSSFESPTGGYTRTGALQVAVAVGMPRPPSQRRSGQHNRGESELCIGLTEIPWNERAVAKGGSYN